MLFCYNAIKAQTIQKPVETRWKKCVVQNVRQLLLIHRLELLCTIIQKPCVISLRLFINMYTHVCYVCLRTYSLYA